MAAIYITEADNTQHSFRLPAEEGAALTIGRNDDCQISLPSVEGISGLHCSITREGGQYIIKDEDSSNGTYVDGRAVGRETLRAGAVYTIGNSAMVFDPETAAAPASKPKPKKKLGTSSSALAEAAASIGVGKRRKVASSALAEAAASIGVKGVGKAPAAAPAAEPVAAAEPAPEPVAAEPAPVVEPAPEPEAYAAPVADSYAAPAEEAAAHPQAVEEPPSEPAPADAPAPAPKKKKRTNKLPAGVPVLKKKSQAVTAGNMFYVILVLALAFYAGMTLRHWMETGTYLPTFEPNKAAKAVKK